MLCIICFKIGIDILSNKQANLFFKDLVIVNNSSGKTGERKIKFK